MKKILFLVMVLVLCSVGYGLDDQVNTFRNGSSKYNITQSQGMNIDIPLYAYVKSFELFVNPPIYDDGIYGSHLRVLNNLSAPYISRWNSNAALNDDLSDWVNGTTYMTIGAAGTYSAHVIYNVSIPLPTNTNLIYNRISYSSPSTRTTLSIYNYSSLSWVQIYNAFSTNIPSICNITYIKVPSDLIQNGNLTVNFSFKQLAAGSGLQKCDTRTNVGGGADRRWMNNTWIIGGIPEFVNISLNDKGYAEYIKEIRKKTKLTFNWTDINNLLIDKCNCLNCSINGNECEIDFYANISHNSILTLDISDTINYSYGIDNCSNSFNIPSNATAWNTSFYNSLGSRENVYSTTSFQSPQLNYTNSSYFLNESLMCIYPNWLNVTGDLTYIYTDINSKTYEYSLTNVTLDNTTNTLSLETQLNTSLVLFTVQDIDSSPIEGAYIYVMKYNILTSTYETTEILKTDSQGQALGNIVLFSTYYNFHIYLGGNLIYQENAVRLISNTRTFTIDLSAATWYDDYSTTLGVNHRLIFNDSTNNFVFTWSDPSGMIHYACLRVVKINRTFHDNLTDSCTQSTSGTIIYNIPLLENGTEYVATSYLKYTNLNLLDRVAKKTSEVFHLAFQDKKLGLSVSFLIILVMFLVGLPNPVIGLILMAGGLIISIMMGWTILISLTFGSIIVMAIIQIYIIGRQNQ